MVFEAVEINKQQGVVLIAVHAPRHSQPDALGKQGPVGKAGKLVIKGELVDSGLVAAAFFFPGKIIKGKAEVGGHFAQQLAHFGIKGSHFHGVGSGCPRPLPSGARARPPLKESRFCTSCHHGTRRGSAVELFDQMASLFLMAQPVGPEP